MSLVASRLKMHPNDRIVVNHEQDVVDVLKDNARKQASESLYLEEKSQQLRRKQAPQRTRRTRRRRTTIATTRTLNCKMEANQTLQAPVCGLLQFRKQYYLSLLLSSTLLVGLVCQAAVVRPTIFSDLNASDTTSQQVSSASAASSSSSNPPSPIVNVVVGGNSGGNVPFIAGK